VKQKLHNIVPLHHAPLPILHCVMLSHNRKDEDHPWHDALTSHYNSNP